MFVFSGLLYFIILKPIQFKVYTTLLKTLAALKNNLYFQYLKSKTNPSFGELLFGAEIYLFLTLIYLYENIGTFLTFLLKAICIKTNYSITNFVNTNNGVFVPTLWSNNPLYFLLKQIYKQNTDPVHDYKSQNIITLWNIQKRPFRKKLKLLQKSYWRSISLKEKQFIFVTGLSELISQISTFPVILNLLLMFWQMFYIPFHMQQDPLTSEQHFDLMFSHIIWAVVLMPICLIIYKISTEILKILNPTLATLRNKQNFTQECVDVLNTLTPTEVQFLSFYISEKNGFYYPDFWKIDWFFAIQSLNYKKSNKAQQKIAKSQKQTLQAELVLANLEKTMLEKQIKKTVNPKKSNIL